MASKDFLCPFVDGLPCSQEEVARLLNLIFVSQDFITNSAIGLRQILPRQTKATFFHYCSSHL